jgi:pyruvate dehydrogenase (quinone)
LAQVARALGARGIRVEEPGDARSALQATRAHTDGPVVVDVMVDRCALALPSQTPAAVADAAGTAVGVRHRWC